MHTSNSLVPRDHRHGFAYKKKGDTGTRTVEICREGCEGVLLLPILRYLSYLSYLRSVHSPSKKEDPDHHDDQTGTRKRTTTGSPQETYQKGRGVTPTNKPPTCYLYRTRRISAASAHAKLYVSEVWGGYRYPGQSYIKANC